VGSYYGGMLAHAGADVHFLMRSDLAAVREQGLTIKTSGETIQVAAQAAGTTAEIGPCDVVLISLKATANGVLDELIPPLLKESTMLVTLQNGLGNEEYLAERWGAERVAGALCFVCLNRTAPREVTHFDHGSISIGEFGRAASPRVRALVEAFVSAGIDAKAVDNLIHERWRKLAWNVPFNGLAIAARGATVADVLADDTLRSEARALMEDVREGAASLGYDIPPEFADFQIERSWSMGPYKPSSLIDWEEGRPVEVEAIWGEPLRQGRRAGAQMPRLALLYALLKRTAKS
jgi:2-dehydropantoate 2-reductase